MYNYIILNILYFFIILFFLITKPFCPLGEWKYVFHLLCKGTRNRYMRLWFPYPHLPVLCSRGEAVAQCVHEQ